MSCWSFTIITIILSNIILLVLKDLLTNFIITCTLKDIRATWLCLVKGYLASLHDLVSVKVEHTTCTRMISITKKNAIGGPCLKLIKLTLLENKAPTTKSPKMVHSRCSPMHGLIARLFQESSKKNLIPHMAHGIHRLSPIFPRRPMLIEHHPSHLRKGTVVPLYHTILTSNIG
jgi:hypothetical protein